MFSLKKNLREIKRENFRKDKILILEEFQVLEFRGRELMELSGFIKGNNTY